MAKKIMSKRKAHALSVALFLVGLAILSLTKTWWPYLMLIIGIPLALRQYLIGRKYDMLISLIVFLGVFITVEFHINWEILLPILFTLGAIYIFFREFFGPKSAEEEKEKEEDLNKEIEEESKKDQ